MGYLWGASFPVGWAPSHLNITKKFAQENVLFNFVAYFIRVKAHVFSLKHENKLKQRVEY